MALLLTSAISLTTYYVVRASLESSRIRSDTRQTIFALLFAREFLRSRPGSSRQLVSLLQTRENFDAMITSGGAWYSTALSLTPRAVPPSLVEAVEREQLAYQQTSGKGSRALVFGAPLPPEGTNLYLFYPFRDVDATLALLARVLAITSAIVIVLAGAFAQRVSRRMLKPLARVSTAAQQVAEGLLETRVEPTAEDELGMLATSFNRMAEALEEMIQRERRFVAALSHEIRTPLAAMKTTSDVLLARRDDLAPSSREAVDLLHDDVAQLGRLIEELLEMSELDARRGAVRVEQVDPRAVVGAIVHQRRREVDVTDGPDVQIATDKFRLERILANLIDNALEHGAGRGVRVTFAVDGDTYLIAVADRGPGISSENLPHLFERFYKADRSRTRAHGGIGLGLAIASQNATLLGGTLDAESVVGEGTSFVLRLPLHREPPGDAAD